MDLGGNCPDATPPDLGLLMREMSCADCGISLQTVVMRQPNPCEDEKRRFPLTLLSRPRLDAPARNCSFLLFALSIAFGADGFGYERG